MRRLMNSTCLLRLSSSWFLAKLVDFVPGPTLAGDRYIVQARDVIGTRAAKRSEILFLDEDEDKVKTLKGVRYSHSFAPCVHSSKLS